MAVKHPQKGHAVLLGLQAKMVGSGAQLTQSGFVYQETSEVAMVQEAPDMQSLQRTDRLKSHCQQAIS